MSDRDYGGISQYAELRNRYAYGVAFLFYKAGRRGGRGLYVKGLENMLTEGGEVLEMAKFCFRNKRMVPISLAQLSRQHGSLKLTLKQVFRCGFQHNKEFFIHMSNMHLTDLSFLYKSC